MMPVKTRYEIPAVGPVNANSGEKIKKMIKSWTK